MIQTNLQRREYIKNWHVEHKEAGCIANRKFYKTHREEILRDRKEWYAKNHKKELKRICVGHVLNRVLCRNLAYQIKLIGCCFCEEEDVDILEFAHVNCKIKRDIKNRRYPIIGRFNGFVKEVEKCEIMCPTCHRKFDLGKLKL